MYTKRDLVLVYLGSKDRGFGGYYPESSTFNAALKAYYVALLDGLEQLFGLGLQMDRVGTFDNRVLFMAFAATADSFLALRTPWSGFLEAGRLLKKVEEAGRNGQRVMAASQRIDTLTAESRETHLEMLDALVAAMLGDRAELTFHEADLRAIGVDVAKPAPAGRGARGRSRGAERSQPFGTPRRGDQPARRASVGGRRTPRPVDRPAPGPGRQA
jgi:hypothetical protein